MPKLKTIVGVCTVVLLAGSYWFYSSGKKNGVPKYKTEKVARGDVTSVVTATGTLSALTTVKVGSQVSGIIARLYVDFNSTVKKGQLLTELDPTPFQSVVDQRRADLERARIEYSNARRSYERSKNLLANQFISNSDYDVAEAGFQSSEAVVKQAEAALRQAESNLSYTRIVSPIDGVVVDRQYDIGQTVAASFQAPTLFTIAQDLTRMQVSTNIDEADIGSIHEGQKATFTVDAFSERMFEGKIWQVRLSPQIVQNVVTYTVLIDVSNPDLQLKPGMTANVTVPIESRTGVLRLPNGALRFKPDPSDLAPENAPDLKDTMIRGPVAYLQDPSGWLKTVSLRISITDGTYTAVESGNVREGDAVVVGFMTSKAMESTGGVGNVGGTRGSRRW